MPTPEKPARPDPASKPPAGTHTEGGAPTDAAHEEAGDGTLSGSIPAGLTADELRDIAGSDRSDDTGTG